MEEETNIFVNLLFYMVIATIKSFFSTMKNAFNEVKKKGKKTFVKI